MVCPGPTRSELLVPVDEEDVEEDDMEVDEESDEDGDEVVVDEEAMDEDPAWVLCDDWFAAPWPEA